MRTRPATVSSPQLLKYNGLEPPERPGLFKRCGGEQAGEPAEDDDDEEEMDTVSADNGVGGSGGGGGGSESAGRRETSVGRQEGAGAGSGSRTAASCLEKIDGLVKGGSGGSMGDLGERQREAVGSSRSTVVASAGENGIGGQGGGPAVPSSSSRLTQMLEVQQERGLSAGYTAARRLTSSRPKWARIRREAAARQSPPAASRRCLTSRGTKLRRAAARGAAEVVD